jgi:hypothetical protein
MTGKGEVNEICSAINKKDVLDFESFVGSQSDLKKKFSKL